MKPITLLVVFLLSAPVASAQPPPVVASSPDGKPVAVTFPTPTVTGPVPCTPSSGSAFPVGVSTVTCSGTLSTSFTVTVKDDTPAPPSGLLQASNLTYTGSFRLPAGSNSQDQYGFPYGGGPLAFNPTNTSLFVGGYAWKNLIAEVKIPATLGTGTVGSLPTATYVQPLTDITEGRLWMINPGDPNSKLIGGLLPLSNNDLIISGYAYYDGASTQKLSHFRSTQTFSTVGDLKGPFQMGTLKAGYVASYMTHVPQVWRTALGGPAVTGMCCVAIVSRTSYGPALSAFDPADVAVKNPIPATPLVYYDASHPLGQWNGTNPYFNGATEVRGVVLPEGSRSALFFGRHPTNGTFCYGAGTSNQALDHQPVPNEPGVIYCYDPEDSSKGVHGYPYSYYVWAYDVQELAKVKVGTIQPWAVKPYAVWPIIFPYTKWSTHLLGAAYDPATNRIFLSQGTADGSKPLIHVFTVKP